MEERVTQSEPEGLLDLAAASRAFGLSRSRLYALAIAGEIPSCQLNGKGKILFRRSDIEALLRPRARVNR
jgi:excisionase family DNA binding protein